MGRSNKCQMCPLTMFQMCSRLDESLFNGIRLWKWIWRLQEITGWTWISILMVIFALWKPSKLIARHFGSGTSDVCSVFHLSALCVFETGTLQNPTTHQNEKDPRREMLENCLAISQALLWAIHIYQKTWYGNLGIFQPKDLVSASYC